MDAETIVEAGTRLLFRVALIVMGLWFLYLVRDVVLIVFAAIIISAAIAPLVTKLREWGVSRALAVVIVYLGLLVAAGTLIGLLVPLFLSQIQDFSKNSSSYLSHLNASLVGLDNYLSTFGISFDREGLLSNLQNSFTANLQGIFSTTVGIFQSIVSVLGFFFLALYLSLEEHGIETLFRALTPKPYQAYVLSVALRMREKVSQWLFAQFLMMLLIFGIYYIGFMLLGLPYALALAFLGGLLEIIPYVGPIVAALPALLIAFLISPLLALSVLLFCFLVQQLEGHVLAPQIMKRQAGLSPVVVIIAILVGASLGGAVGILLAIPTAMILSVFAEDFIEKRQSKAEEVGL